MSHLEHYQTSGPRSSRKSEQAKPRPEAERCRPEAGAKPDTLRSANSTKEATSIDVASVLVNKSISRPSKKRNNPVKSLQVWPRALKLVREFHGKTPPVSSVRADIQSFSLKSKRRLKFTASNAFPDLVSQFGLTYHKTSPDGRTIKHHLELLLKALRKKYKDVKYLWILEFQTRKVPHFHLFLTTERKKEIGDFLAETWHRIAEPDSKEHLKFHKHKKNYIEWDMGSGSYLCKYLDKEHQKAVPEGFTGVGRFWGNSQCLVPEPLEIEADYSSESYEIIDYDTGEINNFDATQFLIRQLCRHHEKSLKGSAWRSSARTRPTSYVLPNGAGVFWSLEKWLYRQRKPEKPPF